MATRNILNSLGEIIGELTLPDETTEAQWSEALAPYALATAPTPIPLQSLSTTTITGSGNVTTSSSTPATVGDMSLVPVSGTYIALFSGSIYTAGASAIGEFGIYVDEQLLPESRRDISCNLQLLGGLVTVSLNSIGVGTYTGTEITLNGNQTIDIKFKSTNGGTIGFSERVFTLIKVR